ncbi:Dipeptidyl aminopeptidase BI [Commensalibacter sp. Nvir]|uniref:S9 family peptidase n=1 Tax=Commensalibacter sp. Nvir TaxID=3069817 RepID=UPI002D32EE2F|nr:Dipeptidyl aminopeptidase BI [Commensalibacter sp. Nvir]
MKYKPPIAVKKTKIIKQFSYERNDSYFWLKDKNWQNVLSDPRCLNKEIKQHLEAENKYTNLIMEETKNLQETLFLQMKERVFDNECSIELKDGEWLYYSKYQKNLEFSLYCRKKQFTQQEQILLNPNLIPHTNDYIKISHVQHSPDHQWLAYAQDNNGSEIWEIHLQSIEMQPTFKTNIQNSTGEFTFSSCSQYVFWIYRDALGRPTKIFRHEILSGKNSLVYEEKDSGYFLNIRRSLSNKWIYLIARTHDTDEVWLIAQNNPTAQPMCFKKRKRGLQYEVFDWNNHFIIKTNADGAYNFKFMRMPIPDCVTHDGFTKLMWQEWLPHQPKQFVLNAIAYSDYFVWLERYEASLRIVIMNKLGQTEYISGDGSAYTLSLIDILNPNSDAILYTFESLICPKIWKSYHVLTQHDEIIKTQQFNIPFSTNDYMTERLWAEAADGETIPITVAYRKDIKQNGGNPLLLYGYGAYGYAIDPTFSNDAMNYIQQGWVYAIAHIRGGSEKGWKWFLDGRKFNKTKSFTDFITCADYLVQQNWTKPKSIVANGRSAGGMVMGYIANLRPDLFAGIIAEVPFVDVLNTMSDCLLPLTPPEWPEWGNPIENRHAYEYIASYSPYDTIKKQNYPAILAVGGLTDPRVTYWEPAKWVAKLREYNQSNEPILLKMNMDSGHGGLTGRYDSLKEAAFIQAFANFVIHPHTH